MANRLNQPYTFSKGDTLDKIARKFGHQDGKTIWKDPENRDIANKRREPGNLQPGDKLVIPPNEKQLKANADELKSLNACRDASLKLRDALANDVTRQEKSVQVYEDLIKSTVKCKNDILEGLEKDLRSMQNTGLAFDTASKMLLAIPGSVFKLAKVGAAAAAAGRDRLKKLAEEIIVDKLVEKIGDDIKDKPLDMVMDELKERKDSSNAAVAAAGILCESWDKIQSPSFWATAFIHRKEGWNEATTREVGDELRERMVQVEKSYNPHIHKLYDARNAAKTKADKNRKLLRECEARANTAEKQAGSLPKN